MKSQSFSDTCDTFETTMNKVLYNTFICVLGLTHLCTLIYGLTLSNDTISHNMLTYLPYRIVLSTCIFLQMGVWTVCIYSKRVMDPHTATWGFLTLGVVTGSWVGLSTILTGMPHYIFVGIFMASFFHLHTYLMQSYMAGSSWDCAHIWETDQSDNEDNIVTMTTISSLYNDYTMKNRHYNDTQWH